MFDDKNYEAIMQDMMKEFGAGVRTDEGSLAFNACCKIAQKLEDVYGHMDMINDNLLPDRQDIDHLIRYASERGIEYEYATAAIVRAVFQQEINIGERFTCNDFTYEVIEKICDFEYKLRCDDEGTEANGSLGALLPIEYINDYKGGEIVEILSLGTDDEDEEVFRARVIDSFKYTAFSGNKADYRLFVDAIDGVGGCKPKRREAGSAWVNITVIDKDYVVPSAELINTVQTAVDPEQSHGEGDGMAPICHNVLIVPVEAVDVSVTTNITFDTGYSVDTSKSLIEAAINEYIISLRKNWESYELDDTIVRISQIENRILAVEGVLDVTDTTLNNIDENLVLSYEKTPFLKEVIINV